MAGAAQRAGRRAMRSGAAASRKKINSRQNMAASSRNIASPLPSSSAAENAALPINIALPLNTASSAKPPSSAKNAATPTKPTPSPITTPNQLEPVAQDPVAASSTPTKALANQNAAQHARNDSSIIQSTETVIAESSTSAARKSLWANDYSDTSSDAPSPMRPASFISATPSSRFGDREKTPHQAFRNYRRAKKLALAAGLTPAPKSITRTSSRTSSRQLSYELNVSSDENTPPRTNVPFTAEQIRKNNERIASNARKAVLRQRRIAEIEGRNRDLVNIDSSPETKSIKD